MNNVIYFGNWEGCDHNSDLLLYILKLLNWEKKLRRFAQSRCAHHAGGILFENGRPFLEYYPIVKKLYVFMVNTSCKLRIWM